MAHTKAGGTAKNLTTSNPQYLGIKLYGGEQAKIGAVIVRQRGTKILPGKNVGRGKDDTLFSLRDGIVLYGHVRKTHIDGSKKVKKTVSVVEKKQ